MLRRAPGSVADVPVVAAADRLGRWEALAIARADAAVAGSAGRSGKWRRELDYALAVIAQQYGWPQRVSRQMEKW